MRSRRPLSLPALFVLVACTWISTAPAQPWLGAETVGQAGVLNGHSAVSLALDAAEGPCVAYYEGDEGDLKFSQYTGGSWVVTTVDTTGDTGQFCSLAIDSFGEPHIAYYYKLEPNETSADFLKYAWRSGGTWNIEVVDNDDVAGFVTLALDASDEPHITYFNGFSTSLMYAHKSGTWSLETVDSSGNTGQHASMVLDGAGDVHVAYQDADNMGIRYAVKSGGGWTFQPIAGLNTSPPAAMTTVHISLALDASGNAHVVYRDEMTGKSQYSKNTSGSWVTTIARSLGQDLQGSFHSLKMAPGNIPTMAYFDNLTQDLKLAPFDGAWWVPKAIREDGISVSLAFDGAGDAHMAYLVPQSNEVLYNFQSDVVSDAGPGAHASRISLAVSPNPMVSATTLMVRTPFALRLGMDILDARGRVVRRIGTQHHEPGTHYVTWDGRDGDGNAVGAGVYFAVSRPTRLFQPRKIVVVR